MTIICSYQKSGTRKAAGKGLGAQKHNENSKGVIFLGSELVTDL